MKVLMLVQSPVAGDSRVLREAAALRKAGHDVHVFGRDVPEDFDPGGGVTVGSVARSRGMKPRSAVAASATAASPRTDAPRAANSGPAAPPSVPSFAAGGLKGRALRGARWFLLPEHRERTERTWRTEAGQALAGSGPFDVVHAHDYNTLALSAELAERWSAQLVYDSHELWFDRGLPGRPTPLRSWRGRRKEAQLAARAQAVLTVSDGIADRLRRRGVSEVTVVRNTFPLAGRVPPPLSPSPAGVAYAGRIGPGRDLEAVVGAAASLRPLRTVLAGPGDPAYRFDHTGVEIVPPMSLNSVDELYQELGIAIVTLTDTCDNHRLALPNKLFHAVRAGVPVVAANLPELHRVVLRHGLGRLYRPGDPNSLADAVRSVVREYGEHVSAVHKARPALSWERDAQVLTEVYAGLESR